MEFTNPKYCYNCFKECPSEVKECPHCSFILDKYMVEPHQLKPGYILRDKYIVGTVLGEGGFGITYVGIDDILGLKVAIKEFYMSGFVNRNNTASARISAETGEKGELFEKNLEKFYSEARVLAKFNSVDGIVSVRDFFHENDTAYMVMDFIEGETLKGYLDKNNTLSIKETLSLLNPLLNALSVVHAAGFIHRDISPDNIILTNNGKVKLIDFGAARDYSDNNRSLSVILKPGYAPEEQYRTKGMQGPWTDVYALSATMYRCISGSRPMEALERLIDDTLPDIYDVSPCSREFSDVIMKGLALRKENRFQNAKEMQDAIQAVSDYEKNMEVTEKTSSPTTIEKEDKKREFKTEVIFSNSAKKGRPALRVPPAEKRNIPQQKIDNPEKVEEQPKRAETAKEVLEKSPNPVPDKPANSKDEAQKNLEEGKQQKPVMGKKGTSLGENEYGFRWKEAAYPGSKKPEKPSEGIAKPAEEVAYNENEYGFHWEQEEYPGKGIKKARRIKDGRRLKGTNEYGFHWED